MEYHNINALNESISSIDCFRTIAIKRKLVLNGIIRFMPHLLYQSNFESYKFRIFNKLMSTCHWIRNTSVITEIWLIYHRLVFIKRLAHYRTAADEKLIKFSYIQNVCFHANTFCRMLTLIKTFPVVMTKYHRGCSTSLL